MDELARVPHFFANKLLPEFDMGALHCWHEYLRNRTVQAKNDAEEEAETAQEWDKEDKEMRKSLTDLYQNLAIVRVPSSLEINKH